MEKKKYKDFEFDLFGTKWQVKFVEKVDIKDADDSKFYFGHSDGIRSIITIAVKDDEGNPLKEDTIALTLIHEIIHAIFGNGCYNNSCDDEPLVEWTAKCIMSLIKQNVLTYDKFKI